MDIKKVMAVTAAVIGTTAMANVVSSSVVGYNNTGLRDYGQLVTASFLGVSAGETFNLSDVKITGYENNETFKDNGATDGDFYFTRLDDSGFTMDDTDYFAWVDVYEDGEWQGGAWYDYDGNEVNADNDYVFDAGEAFWFIAPAAEAGEAFKFVSSGKVNPNDLDYELRDYGNAVGNPNPIVTKLSKVSVTGYENNETFKENGATDGDFYFTRLDDSGFTMDDTDYFAWVDVYEDGEWQGGAWYDYDGNEVNEDNDYDIAIGEALWFIAPAAGEKELFVLEFPTAIPTPAAS